MIEVYLCHTGQQDALTDWRGADPSLSFSCLRGAYMPCIPGGYFSEGYLNGHIGVTRGIGDFHLGSLKQRKEANETFTGPLIAGRSTPCFLLTRSVCRGHWYHQLHENHRLKYPNILRDP